MAWTLQEQAQYTRDSVYKDRVYFGFLKTANDVVNEASNTANHENRLTLAQQVINGSGPPVRATMLLHILNPALQVEGGEPTDNDILFTIAQQWDYFSAAP